MFRPGGGRGALYVLAQMALFLACGVAAPADVGESSLVPGRVRVHLPVHRPAGRGFPLLRPARAASFQLRVAVLVLLSIGLVLPDILFYVLWQPAVFDLRYAGTPSAQSHPDTGELGRRGNESRVRDTARRGPGGTARLPGADPHGDAHDGAASPIDPLGSASAAGEPGSANILY